LKRDVKNKATITQTEMQKLHFHLTVMRTLKARIHFKGKTLEEKEEILTFFNQSLGNARFLWNTLLNRSQQHYFDYTQLSDEQKAEKISISVKNKNNEEVMKEVNKHKSFLTRSDLSDMLTKMKKESDYHFLNLSHSQSLQDITERLSETLQNVIKKRMAGEDTNVNFKSKKDDSSFIIKQVKDEYINFKKNTILLPKLKKTIGFILKNKIKDNEKVKTLQIVKENNNWYFCFTLETLETEQERLCRLERYIEKIDELRFIESNEIKGFDFGVNTFLTGDDGKKIIVPKKIKKQIEKLTARLHRVQRITSSIQLIKNNLINLAKEEYKKEFGHEKDFDIKNFKKVKDNYISKEALKQSENEKKLYDLQRKLYKKITYIKNDFLHKISNTLSKNHACIVMEKLNIKGMTKSQRRINLEKSPEYKEKLKQKMNDDPEFKKRWTKRKLNRKMLSFPFGKLTNLMRYKMQRENHVFIKVDPAYTSQTCHVCHHVEKANR
jgi:transposase